MTRNFEPSKVKLLLEEIDECEGEILSQYIYESEDIYIREKWEIPTIKVPYTNANGESKIEEFDDIKTMLLKTHLPDVAFYYHIKEMLESKLQESNSDNKNKSLSTLEPPTPPRKDPQTLEDIFIKPELLKPCIEALNTIGESKKYIDIDGKFIGKPLGILCVWYEVLEEYGLIKIITRRSTKGALIKEAFKLNSFDESNFTKYGQKAETYRDVIRNGISQISLSEKRESNRD